MRKIKLIVVLFCIIFMNCKITVFANENEPSEDPDNTNEIYNLEEPQNSVPLVIVRVDESEEAIQNARDKDPEHEYGNIEEMNVSKHHTVRGVGTIEIIVPEDYESEYNLKNHPIGEQKLSYIRGRGNSTWMISDKKPYKIKFDKKQDVLGMGKNKEWGLIANAFDPTLTHNAIMSWVGEEMGMEYTPKMVPVDLVMIGSESGSKYLGSYYLTELTDIGDNRIEINELDEDDTDDITGGYLLTLYYDEQDFKEPENTVFETEYSNVKLINENPYFDEGELTEGQQLQRQYIRDYVNQIDEYIMNHETIDEDTHNKINDLLDLKSTADFWLIQEFFINFDGYKTSSNYLYKKENGKLYWGPLWDFDLMMYMVDPEEPIHAMGFNCTLPFPWLDKLRSDDPLFVQLLKDEWSVLNEKLIRLTEEGGILDQYKERQRATWNANYTLWKEGNYYDNDTTIDEEFDKVRTIIDFRRNWFNENLDHIGNVNSTVSFEVDGKIVKTVTIRTDSLLEDINLKPEKEGFLFECWVDKETNESIEGTKIFKDTIAVPKYIDLKEIDEDIVFFLSTYEDWVFIDKEEYENSVMVFPEEYRELITKNMKWESSDPSVATVENNVVKLHATGDTTITATIFNGTSKSYLLHVFDENYETIEEPEGIVPEQEEYTIEVGEVIQLVTPFTPNKPINPENWIDVSKEVSDDAIIDVGYGYYYTVKGLKEGTATVTLEIYSSYSDRHYGEKTITINVVEKKEQQDDPKEEDPKDDIKEDPEETDPPQQTQEDKKDSVPSSDKSNGKNTDKSQKNNSNKSYTGKEKKTSAVTNTSTNEEKKSKDHDAEITDNQSVETEPVINDEEKVDTEEQPQNTDTEIIDNSAEEKDLPTKEEVNNRNWYIWTVPVVLAFILIFLLKRRKKEE